MRVLFAYDHRFKWAADGRTWTTGALSASVWSRYLKVFGKIEVVARDGGQVEDGGGLARADTDDVSFTLLQNVSSAAGTLKRRDVRRRMVERTRLADAVIARLPSEYGLMACVVARSLGKPYLVEVVGSAYDALSNYGSWAGRLYAPVAERRVRRAVSRAPFVIYVTEKWLQSQYPSSHPEIRGKAAKAPVGLQAGATDALLQVPGSTAAAASVTNASVVLPESKVHLNRNQRLEAIEAGQAPVLGTIGSLATRYKGVQVALPALAQLRSEGFDFTYRILGGGDLEPWRQLIHEHGLGDRCFLDGVLRPGAEVLEWLDGIDIYLQPSLQEGLPRAVLEAMSRGLACIGSSAGGLPELIAPGYIHAPGDVPALRDHLRKLLSGPEEVARLSAYSLEGVTRYAPSIVEAKREAMLRALQFAATNRRDALVLRDPDRA